MSAKEAEKSSSMVKNVGGFFFKKFKKKSVKSLTKEQEQPSAVKEGDKKVKKNFFSRFDKSDKSEAEHSKFKSIDADRHNDDWDETKYDFNLSETEINSSLASVKAPALNNAMAKSKIRAASKRKPSNRPKLSCMADFEPFDPIEEGPINPVIANLKNRSRSNSAWVKSFEELTEAKLGEASSEILGSLQSPRTHIKPSTNYKKSSSHFDSKESLSQSSENIIELAKKSLKTIKLNAVSTTNKPSNTIYNIGSHNETAPASNQFQQLVFNKSFLLSSLSSTNHNKKNHLISSNQKSLAKSSEFLCHQSTESIDEIKPSNSETSSTTSAIQNYCQILMSTSSSDSSSSSEKLSKSFTDKAKASKYEIVSNSEKPTPIYDNFTLPQENDYNRMSTPESFVHKLNKKTNDSKAFFKNRITLADKDPEAEICFIKSKLRHTEPNNSRSVEELNALNSKRRFNRSNNNGPVEETCVQSTKLAYSKSLKIVQKPKDVENSNGNELLSKLDFPVSRANKVILAIKNKNQSTVLDSISIEDSQQIPLKKVSDLIKNLNSQQNPLVVPVWKDLAMKKKNAWMQQKSVDSASGSEKIYEMELQKTNADIDSLPLKANQVKSIIMGLEEK